MLGGPTSDELFNLGLHALTDNNDSGRSKAIDYFIKAQTHAKPHPVASYMLGQIYEAKDPITTNTEAAFLAYKQALVVDSTFIAAWLALERCFQLGIGTPKNEEFASLCRENILLIDKNMSQGDVGSNSSSEMTKNLKLAPLPITHCYSSYNEKIKELEKEIEMLNAQLARQGINEKGENTLGNEKSNSSNKIQ